MPDLCELPIFVYFPAQAAERMGGKGLRLRRAAQHLKIFEIEDGMVEVTFRGLRKLDIIFLTAAAFEVGDLDDSHGGTGGGKSKISRLIGVHL